MDNYYEYSLCSVDEKFYFLYNNSNILLYLIYKKYLGYEDIAKLLFDKDELVDNEVYKKAIRVVGDPCFEKNINCSDRKKIKCCDKILKNVIFNLSNEKRELPCFTEPDNKYFDDFLNKMVIYSGDKTKDLNYSVHADSYKRCISDIVYKIEHPVAVERLTRVELSFIYFNYFLADEKRQEQSRQNREKIDQEELSSSSEQAVQKTKMNVMV